MINGPFGFSFLCHYIDQYCVPFYDQVNSECKNNKLITNKLARFRGFQSLPTFSTCSSSTEISSIRAYSSYRPSIMGFELIPEGYR
jgi:hypothetical protein